MGVLGGCWCEQRFRSVVPGLLVVSLFLPLFFVVCWCSPVCLFHGHLGGLGIWVVFVLLVLLRVALGLAFDGLLGLVVSVVVEV